MSQAIRVGVPKRMLIQMGSNIALELGVGVIPLFGDVFDFAFKANQKNVTLIEQHLDAPSPTNRRSALWVFSMILVLVVIILAIGWITVEIFAALWRLSS